jgi:hypothetical protein
MIGRLGRFVPGKCLLPGAVSWRWEPPVPFVYPGVLGSSIFLYGSEDDATNGANWGGSGFLVGIPSKANPSRTHHYAVSNDHVIQSCPVIRFVDVLGKSYVLDGTAADWDSHPDGDDIAICSLGANAGGQVWCVGDDLLLSREDLNPEERPYQVSPGDDCLMVGRYINQDLRQFDRPVVRFGNLAMLPEHVYQHERSFDQESFLVDMRSQPGFSGSPVFVYYEETGWRYLPPLREVPETEDPVKDAEDRVKALEEQTAGRHVSGVMSKTWLLGIDWGHLPVWGDVYDDSKQRIGRTRVSTGMAGVVPAWKLRDLLNEEGIRMARDKAEERLAEKDEGAAELDASKPDEFAEFEDLTRKLVQVPKREIDEKREKK